MSAILFYDSETDKLVDFKMPSDDPCQPHITELAAKLVDEETREVYASMSVLIRPEGWTVPADITELTGITNELLLARGVPIGFALEMFVQLWKNASKRVAHNESFDMRVLRTAFKRDEVFQKEMVGEVEFADHWKAAPAYCTQANSTKIVNLPPTAKMAAKNMKGPKSPNLGEAYFHFTGRELAGAHRADADVDAAIAVYFGIKDHHARLAAV